MIDPSGTLAAARRLRRAITALIALILGAVALAALPGPFDEAEMIRAVTGRAHWDGPPLHEWQQVALAAIGALHLVLWLAILLLARGLFGRFAAGDPVGAARRARRLGAMLWGMAGWSVLSSTLATLALTWTASETTLAIGLGSAQLSLALAALVAGFLARAFALGAELWRDHREVV